MIYSKDTSIVKVIGSDILSVFTVDTLFGREKSFDIKDLLNSSKSKFLFSPLPIKPFIVKIFLGFMLYLLFEFRLNIINENKHCQL